MENIDEILDELQQLLASADLSQKRKNRSFEIEVARRLNMKFRMEPDHHPRPHIHIQYGKENHKASYAIDNGELLAGELPAQSEKVVVKWIFAHSDLLKTLWIALKEGRSHNVITKKLQSKDD